MQKRVGIASGLALVMLLYLIWQDPTGTALLFKDFFSAVGGFVGDLWERLTTFFTSL